MWPEIIRKEFKQMNTELTLIKNTLRDNESNVKRLEFENDYFTIKLIYNGDYVQDKTNDTISKENIRIFSKAKSPLYCPTIGYANGNISVTLPSITLFENKTLTDFDNKFIATFKTKLQLEQIIENYF